MNKIGIMLIIIIFTSYDNSIKLVFISNNMSPFIYFAKITNIFRGTDTFFALYKMSHMFWYSSISILIVLPKLMHQCIYTFLMIIFPFTFKLFLKNIKYFTVCNMLSIKLNLADVIG